MSGTAGEKESYADRLRARSLATQDARRKTSCKVPKTQRCNGLCPGTLLRARTGEGGARQSWQPEADVAGAGSSQRPGALTKGRGPPRGGAHELISKAEAARCIGGADDEAHNRVGAHDTHT
jgi:hypothetical protein